MDRVEQKTSKAYERGITKLLNVQENKVIDLVDNVVAAKSKDITKQIVEFSGSIFSMTFTKEEIELNLLAHLLRAIQQAGEAGIDLTSPPDVEFLITQAERERIFQSTERLAKSFNKETADKIQKAVAAGLQNNESQEQITKRIESIYVEAKGYRAERIANTEAHKATNYASAQAWKQSGIKEMTWRANPGACEFCRAMDGTTVPIGTPFVPKGGTIEGTDGGTYLNDYDSIDYADAHPNCTCKLVPNI